MVAPDRSIEDAALIAFVRERRDEMKDSLGMFVAGGRGAVSTQKVIDMYDALLSRLEGTQGTAELEAAIQRAIERARLRLEGRGTEQAETCGHGWHFGGPCSDERADAVRLLRQLVEPCDGTTEHSWRACRRCMAVHGVEMRFKLSMRLLTVAAEALASSPASVATGAAADVEAILRSELTCRDGAPHYCQNCDNSISAERIIKRVLASPAPLPDAAHVAWRSMESAPKDGTRILISDARFMGGSKRATCLSYWVPYTRSWSGVTEATHWMPVPNDPPDTSSSPAAKEKP